MKTIGIRALVAGGYRLQIRNGDGSTTSWRSDTPPIPTAEEAQHRAEVIAATLGYRLDKRVRHGGAPATPTPIKEDQMGTTATAGDQLAKGTTVKIVAANLKDKRREQLGDVLRKTGTIIRFLNGRYYVAFKDGDTKWWLAADQVKAVETAKADETEAATDPAPAPKRKGRKPVAAEETTKEAGAEAAAAASEPVAV